MKQVLHIYFKNNTTKQINCDHFTLTSVGTLLITYGIGREKHIEEIDMNDVEMFGGWSNED